MLRPQDDAVKPTSMQLNTAVRPFSPRPASQPLPRPSWRRTALRPPGARTARTPSMVPHGSHHVLTERVCSSGIG
eukprot:COSAG02_NODE_1162_length_14168_cov_10.478570_7_plen_75_part_00